MVTATQAHPAPAKDAPALRRARGALAVAAIALALLAAPAASRAATSCGFAGSTLSVDLSETGDEARLFVAPSDQILVINHEGSIVGCTGAASARTTNTARSWC
jgi:hypothetical protein